MKTPKWLKAVSIRSSPVGGADLDFVIRITRENLDKARERGDAIHAAELSWQMDQLLKMRHQEDSDA